MKNSQFNPHKALPYRLVNWGIRQQKGPDTGPLHFQWWKGTFLGACDKLILHQQRETTEITNELSL